MAFALGGLAQFIGGILEFKHGNTFGGTVFTVYGFFWWSLIFILLNPGNVAAGADSISLGFYLLLWAFITFLFFIAALKLDRTTQAVLCTLTLVFLGLSIANFSGAPEVLTVTAWLGVICGLIAIYGAMAQVINEVHGKTVFPLGLPK
jgi:succinate-acetate transporter protein